MRFLSDASSFAMAALSSKAQGKQPMPSAEEAPTDISEPPDTPMKSRGTDGDEPILTRKSDVANALEALIVKAARENDASARSIYHEGIHALIAVLSTTSDAALEDESEVERLRRELSEAKLALAEAEGEGVEARRASFRSAKAAEEAEKAAKEAARKAVEKERERIMGAFGGRR